MEAVDSATLVERARKLAPLLASDAAEAERLRRPTDAVIQALRDQRIFDSMVPRCYGGLELDLDTFHEVGLALSEGDASMGWVATFYIEHNWMLCQFPESFQRELFDGRTHVLAPGTIAPTGRVEKKPGGYRLSGRWQWGTGAMHGEWAMVGALLEGAAPLFFALPMQDLRVDDTWFVDGMAATGSNDLVVEDVFIPEERTASLLDMAEGRSHGARLHGGPLYRTPMLPILGLAASMPALGQARAVVRSFRASLLERPQFGGKGRQADRPTQQVRLARIELEVHQAELAMRDVVEQMMEKRDAASREDRARWLACLAHVVHQSKAIIQQVAAASGASAHFQSHPLQRAQRDVNTLSCHIVFDLDQRLEMFGSLRLDRDPGIGLL